MILNRILTTTKISTVSEQQEQPKNIQQQICSHDLLKQVFRPIHWRNAFLFLWAQYSKKTDKRHRSNFLIRKISIAKQFV